MNAFPRDHFRQQIAELAAQGIYVGTSSWKYEGWLGLIYSPDKYLRYFKEGPPKILKGRFEKTCLTEYAETFKTVCLDGAYYQFPTPQMLDGYFSQVPSDFQLSMKVTDIITVLRWPKQARVTQTFLMRTFSRPLFSGRSRRIEKGWERLFLNSPNLVRAIGKEAESSSPIWIRF